MRATLWNSAKRTTTTSQGITLCRTKHTTNSDSAIKTPTDRPIAKQSGAKSTEGPTKREIEIADIVNNSIQSELFVTTLVPVITNAIQHVTIRQTISAAITTSMTYMQNIITNQQILLSNQQRTIEGLTNKTKQVDEIIESQNVKINDQLNTMPT